MYNATRSIFPAYTGLDDIRVALPAPPTRSSVARGVEDLWTIHSEEPHINVLTDPGVASPLPDEGFNPQTDLTETSPANILANRGSRHLSDEKAEQLTERLDDLYTQCLTTNLQMSGMSVGELKEYMNDNAPGALLVYNGADKDSLIKAYTLIQALEKLVDLCDKEATFPMIAKGELVGFVSCCESVREAMLLPNHMIRQKLFGSTEARDELEQALDAYDLGDEADTRKNPQDAEFADYHQAISLNELELENAVNDAIEQGIAQQAIDNALNQVSSHIPSPEVKKALHSTIDHVKSIANRKSQKGGKSLQDLLGDMRKDLKSLGVDPQFVSRLQQKEAEANRLSKKKRHFVSVDVDAADRAKRSPQSVQATADILKQMQNGMMQYLEQAQLSPIANLATRIELYTIMCMHDCCIMLAMGQPKLKSCAENLHVAVCEELKTSNVAPFRQLKSKVDSAHKDLHSQRKSSTMAKLNKAQTENAISDKKLKTLTTLLG